MVVEGEATAAGLDRLEAAALVERDLAALSTIWADELLVTPPNGPPTDKRSAIRLVDEGVLAYRTVEREVDHVVEADGLIVSLGRERVTPIAGGPQARRYTHVWRQRGGSWQLLSRHASAWDGD